MAREEAACGNLAARVLLFAHLCGKRKDIGILLQSGSGRGRESGNRHPRPWGFLVPHIPAVGLPGASSPRLVESGIPLRVIQVVNVRWFNATAWYGLFLSRLLKEAGHEVRVLALDGTESFAKAREWGLDPLPYPLNTSNPLVLFRLYRNLTALMRAFNPQVVNCHRGESFMLWGLLKARGHRFALVRTRGDQRPPKGNSPNRFLHARLADALIATNSRTAADLRRILRVPEEKLHTILGGVDTGCFFPDPEGRRRLRDMWGLAEHEFAVGLLGRFDEVKGQKELIRAVGMLRAEGRRQVRLVLAGFPASLSREDLTTCLSEAGLADSTVITGRRSDIRACIAALDLGVAASTGSEAIARAALEIMACGVPLLGSDVGVMSDLLDASALVPPGDVPALADALRRILDEPARKETLARRQRMRMEELSERLFLARTLAVYTDALRRIAVPGFREGQ
jgi:glycosyltransferase involved in cell wall biosynthesis